MSNVANESSGQQSANIHLTSKTEYKKIISNGNYSDIVYYNEGAIHASDGFIFLIALHDAIIPVTWYVISEYNNNNTLNYQIDEDVFTFTIPDGNYSAYNIINLFNTSDIKLSNGITTSYNIINNKMTFTHTLIDFTILSTSTCLELIGLNEGVNTSSSSFILVCPNQVDLAGTREIYIKSNLHTINLDSRIGTITSSILGKIPVVVESNNLIYYSNITQNRSILKDRIISKIQITIEDDKGVPLDLTNHYSLTIEVQITPNKFLVYEKSITNGL